MSQRSCSLRWCRILVVGSVLCLIAGACSSGTDSSSPDSTLAETTTTTSVAVVGPAARALSVLQPEAVPTGDWPHADPAAQGFDPAGIATMMDHAQATKSFCVAVTRHGQLVAEKYWDGHSQTSHDQAFSVTKSFASALVGQAVSEGKLRVDDPATTWVPEWKGTPSESATLKDLLQMDAGRPATGGQEIGAMLAAKDWTQAAIDLPAAAAPNTVWGYSNNDVQVLNRVLNRGTGTSPETQFREQLLGPLGMRNSELTLDGTGQVGLFFGLLSNCPDLARFGLLYLNSGKWGAKQIVDPNWVKVSVEPGPLNPGYGYLWWLNAHANPAKPGLEWPKSPPDTFMARGLGGQQIVVIPSLGVVATRMHPSGMDNTDSFSNEFSDLLTGAIKP